VKETGEPNEEERHDLERKQREPAYELHISRKGDSHTWTTYHCPIGTCKGCCEAVLVLEGEDGLPGDGARDLVSHAADGLTRMILAQAA
jgi:hypothetical protein